MDQYLLQILKFLEGLSNIELIVINLFCAAGGMSDAVEKARMNGLKCAKVFCCITHDKNAILSHVANMPDALHFIEDINTLDLTPVFGHTTGRHGKTHWKCLVKAIN